MTDRQRRAFWRLFSVAVREQEIPPENRDTYRHSILKEYAGVNHMADLSKISGYERVMSKLAIDANDYEAAAYWSLGESRRANALAEDCARQLFEILDTPDGRPREYIAGILKQSRLAPSLLEGTSWLDIAEDDLPKVFMIIDTERRRQLRRIIERPIAYRYGRCWYRSEGQLMHIDTKVPPPPPLFINRRTVAASV